MRSEPYKHGGGRGNGSRMRKKISPSMAVACVALFFSIGGATAAATGYRITSIWQIAPKVRHELRTAKTPAYYSADVEASLCSVSAPGCTPSADLVARCEPGDPLLTGGFQGVNDVVTFDDVALDTVVRGTITNGWGVDAHLEQGETSGVVWAHALCVHR